MPRKKLQLLFLLAWWSAGGNAVADVLFGDYNPAGRLPVTYYKTIDQIPAFGKYMIWPEKLIDSSLKNLSIRSVMD